MPALLFRNVLQPRPRFGLIKLIEFDCASANLPKRMQLHLHLPGSPVDFASLTTRNYANFVWPSLTALMVQKAAISAKMHFELN